MGIFDRIKGAIFGNATAAPSASPASPGPASTAAPTSENVAQKPRPSSAQPVDVEAVLEKAVAAKGQKLNWRTSIVDLMKALDLDSSLSARKELAQELNYTGDMNDSAKMNMWLHKALMKKLAENGGKVPADLTD